MATDVSICSNALVLIGDSEINSLSDNSLGAQVCRAIYETTKENMFQSYPWRFAIGQKSLNRLVASPLFTEFKYAYKLPSDFKRLIRTQNDTPFKIYEDNIYSNEQTLEIEYEFIVDESKFPAYFTRALEFKMASILAVSISENSTKAQLFDQLFEKQMVTAKAADNQSKNTDMINSNILTSVRF